MISLDFELRWGMYDKLGRNFDAYRANLEGVQSVVPALLKLFMARNIRATWACVGALGCRDWNEYFARAPEAPKYQNPQLAFDPQYAEMDPRGHLHFAPNLLQAVRATPGQELGTHTFSHILMREPGVTAADVEADLAAASRLWQERYETLPRSLVFPRNQPAFLPVVRKAAIRIWRGNATPWYYDRNEAATNSAVARGLRLLDSLNLWARRASALEGDMTRAALFLRVDLPSPAWALHFARIRRELRALRPGETFHFYFHPHNLGVEMRARLARVEQVLDLVAEKRNRGLLESRCMGDLVP